MNNIHWTDNSIIFVTEVNQYDVQYNRDIEIKLNGDWLIKGSLLDACLESLKGNSPIRHSIALNARFAIDSCQNEPNLKKILQSAPESLTQSDINALFVGIEAAIDKLNIKQKYQKSIDARIIFSRSHVSIANGDLVSSIHKRYKSTFTSRKLPISINNTATPFESLEELYEKTEQEYKARKEEIFTACETDIDHHIATVDLMTRFKNTPLPDPDIDEHLVTGRAYVTKVVKSGFNPLHINSRLITLKSLHYYNNMAAYIKEVGSSRWIKTGGVKEYRFYQFLKQDNNKYLKNDNGILLADIFLPRRILLACQIILQLTTGSNSSPVRTLTRERIISTPKGYELIGLKGKTDAIIRNEINKKTDPLACKAIELLLKHDANITEFWKRESDSVFCSYSNGMKFKLTRYGDTLKKFIEWHDLDVFTIEDLRDLYAQHDYLVHRDPFRTQALLDHAQIAATDNYLQSTVIGLINEANITEFMRRLAPSIAFSVNPGDIKQHGFNEDKIDKALLFPVSKYDSATDAISDKWLMDQENYNFTINRSVIEYCAYQRNYYKKHLDSLISSNHKKFSTYHLPRILFCIALYRLIKASEFGDILKKTEEALK